MSLKLAAIVVTLAFALPTITNANPGGVKSAFLCEQTGELCHGKKKPDKQGGIVIEGSSFIPLGPGGTLPQYPKRPGRKHR